VFKAGLLVYPISKMPLLSAEYEARGFLLNIPHQQFIFWLFSKSYGEGDKAGSFIHFARYHHHYETKVCHTERICRVAYTNRP